VGAPADPPPLAAGYYLDNFATVLRDVAEQQILAGTTFLELYAIGAW
jgi:hypothetical protein